MEMESEIFMDNLNSFEYTDTSTEASALSWGRSYLMCPPDYFGIFYEINPWMHTENATDRDLAQEQWHNLVANLRQAGATQFASDTFGQSWRAGHSSHSADLRHSAERSFDSVAGNTAELSGRAND